MVLAGYRITCGWWDKHIVLYYGVHELACGGAIVLSVYRLIDHVAIAIGSPDGENMPAGRGLEEETPLAGMVGEAIWLEVRSIG